MSFQGLGRLMFRRRWIVIALWLLTVLVAAPWFIQVPRFLRVGGFSSPNTESAQARDTLQKDLGTNLSVVTVVYASQTLTANDPEFVNQVQQSLGGLSGVPGVERTLLHTANPRQVSPDGHTAYEQVVLSAAPEDSAGALPAVEERIRQPPGLSMVVSGAPVFYADIVQLTSSDLRRAETVAFPIAAAVLIIVFGSAIAAGVPLVIGGAGVLVTVVLIALLAQFTEMSIFVLNVTTMLGLGLGVDYALFMTNRFREELRTHSVEESVAITLATSGRAVFFSGLTVCVGLLALVGFDFMILRTIGIAGSMVVLITVIAAMTLLPALLGVLGQRVNALSVHLPLPDAGSAWRRLAQWVMRRPVAVIVPVLAVLCLLGGPLRDIDLSSPDASILPATVPSRQGFDQLKQSFGAGALDPILVVVKASTPILDRDNIDRLYDFTHRLEHDARIAGIDSVTSIDPRLTKAQYELLYADPTHIPDLYALTIAQGTTRNQTALVQVISRYPPLSDESRGIVAEARELARQYPGWQVQVDGGAAEVSDVVDRLYSEFPRAILFIAVTTYVLLTVLFRSLVLPLKALVMNALSLVASYGALVWVFQEGHLSGLLHFSPLGFIEASLPIIMFCTLFGLSMDYEVFLLSRVKEAYEQTRDNTFSVAEGLHNSGRIITSAALIVVCVSMSFVTADIVLIKALGLGVAVAVAVDATIVRALLVPATMRLLGKWNWWFPGQPRTAGRLGSRLETPGA
ncbi:MAG: MMPL family transporter [Chloroflexi bacterium]|nr:MMPL family transporter [Chloroflexota bacterium]